MAHLLISAISLECGYAASAIRERIYCADRRSEVPMAAILLSTGTAGSDGTLGGLVEQARKVRTHLRRAWDMGPLRSNDPVCGSHSPRGDHAERFLEGSACHGCLFITECSCERFNRYLDSALVVPVIGHESVSAPMSSRGLTAVSLPDLEALAAGDRARPAHAAADVGGPPGRHLRPASRGPRRPRRSW